VLLLCGGDDVSVLLLCGGDDVSVMLLCGGDDVCVLLLCGGDDVCVLLLCGGDDVCVLLLCGGDDDVLTLCAISSTVLPGTLRYKYCVFIYLGNEFTKGPRYKGLGWLWGSRAVALFLTWF